MPFGVIYTFNLIMFIIIIISVLRHKSNTDKVPKLKRIFKNATVALVLAIMFGVGWIFGILGSDIGQGQVLILACQYLFIFIVGFQGLLIFILYPCRTKHARNEWKKWFYYATCRCRLYQDHVKTSLNQSQDQNRNSSTARTSGGTFVSSSSARGQSQHRPRAGVYGGGGAASIAKRFGAQARPGSSTNGGSRLESPSTTTTALLPTPTDIHTPATLEPLLEERHPEETSPYPPSQIISTPTMHAPLREESDSDHSSDVFPEFGMDSPESSPQVYGSVFGFSSAVSPERDSLLYVNEHIDNDSTW